MSREEQRPQQIPETEQQLEKIAFVSLQFISHLKENIL